jgi:hypothetical protein
MKLSIRQRLIIWAEGSRWARPLWIKWIIRRDQKLAATEYDKIPDVEGYVEQCRGTLVMDRPNPPRTFRMK